MFFINWFVNILVIEILAIRKLETVANVDEARDSKYPAFRRYDTFWYSRLWLYPTCHLMLFKFILCFTAIFMCALFGNIISLGLKPNDPVTGIRYAGMRLACYLTARIVVAGMGCYWITLVRPKVDYSEYLGPDWKPDYEKKGTATVISTHSSFADTAMHAMYQLPSIIAKFEV